MKPKNSKDRRASFFKFLALFAVTITAILFAVYFNFKVPNKENAILKNQVKSVEKEMVFQDGFSNEMKSIRNMIDSLGINGTNMAYQNNLISAKLVDLQKTIPTKDSTYRYDMYTNIITVYAELLEGKMQLHQLKDSKATIDEYKIALDKVKADFKQCERDLYIARGSN
ncbi:type VI secretion system transmembrane protein TssO [Lacinutrix cladophorae]